MEKQDPEATQPSLPQPDETQPTAVNQPEELEATRAVPVKAQPTAEEAALEQAAPLAAPQGELETTRSVKVETQPVPEEAAPEPAAQQASQPAADESQPVPAARRSVWEVASKPPSSPASPAGPVGPAGSASEPKRRRFGWAVWAIMGVVLLTLIALVSGYAGYLSAIERRTAYAATQVAGDAQTQFDLGVQDLEAGRYDLARQRFEYVIQLNPGFPGVTEKLAEALMRINATATPTIEPTPTLTPTPDLRNQETIFAQAQTQLAAGDWTGTIDTLLTLRKRFPDYRAVEVDGMIFVALRNRGVQKISQQADLEGGIYDLALAGRFGPVDVEAKNWGDWAELYVRGASFWDVDWEQVVFYFGQLAQIAPNLMDGSGYTSTERYRLGLIGYGDWLALQERWCEAEEQYDLSYDMSPRGELEPTAEYAADQCANPTSEPQPEVPTATVTPTLPAPPPPEQPTATPTPETVVEPTATETPTPAQ